MTDTRVAKRYASALFNTALKQDILQSVEEDLDVPDLGSGPSQE